MVNNTTEKISAGAMMTKEEGKAFFLNFAMDISPSCDCYGWTDTPIVNGLGILASYDPVEVDKACIDMMNAAPGLLNSEAEEFGAPETGAKKLNVIKGKNIEAQIYGGMAKLLVAKLLLTHKILLHIIQP